MAPEKKPANKVSLLCWARPGEAADPPSQSERLHLYASEGKVHKLRSHLSKGGKVDKLDQEKWTLLHSASEKGALEAVQFLLAHGAAMEARTAVGYTPLMLAAREGHLMVCNELMERGAERNAATEARSVLPALLSTAAQPRPRRWAGRRSTWPRCSAKWRWCSCCWTVRALSFSFTPTRRLTARLSRANPLLSVTGGADSEAVTKQGKTPLKCTKDDAVKEVLSRSHAMHGAAFETGQEALDKLRLALDSGEADVNAHDVVGWTPLHCAVRENKLLLVQLLLEKGANVNTPAKSGDTPLHFASGSDLLPLATLLLESGAWAELVNEAGHTPAGLAKSAEMKALLHAHSLHGAAQDGNLAWLSAALVEGRDASAADPKDGYTALHYAAASKGTACMAVLVEKEADINARSLLGNTPLHVAAFSGRREGVKFLVAHGADKRAKNNAGSGAVDVAKGESVRELVMERVSENELAVAAFEGQDEKLAAASAEARSVKAEGGRSLLHFAAAGGRAETVALLVGKLGADVEARDAEGQTALHCASARGEVGCVQALLKGGAKLESATARGSTALLVAAHGCHLGCAQALLEKGAAVSAKGSAGATPLHWAARRADAAMTALLLSHGADVKVKNEDGKTPDQVAESVEVKALIAAAMPSTPSMAAEAGAGRVSENAAAVQFGHAEERAEPEAAAAAEPKQAGGCACSIQ